jgi:hypothetical protein
MWLRLIIDFVDSITLRRGRWFPFEQQLLDDLSQRLSNEASKVFKSQIKSARSIVREAELRSVLVYYNRRGGNKGLDNLPAFVDQSEQIRLATAKLKRENSRKTLKVDFWLVHGHLFEISYSSPPKIFFGTRDLDSVRPTSIEFVIWVDPMVDNAKAQKKAAAPFSLDEAQAMLGSQNVHKLATPFLLETIERELLKFESKFPEDYIEFLSKTDGCTVDGCDVLCLNLVRSVAITDSTYIILAEQEGHRALALKENTAKCELFAIDYSDEIPISLGVEFLPTLKKFRQNASDS